MAGGYALELGPDIGNGTDNILAKGERQTINFVAGCILSPT